MNQKSDQVIILGNFNNKILLASEQPGVNIIRSWKKIRWMIIHVNDRTTGTQSHGNQDWLIQWSTRDQSVIQTSLFQVEDYRMPGTELTQ